MHPRLPLLLFLLWLLAASPLYAGEFFIAADEPVAAFACADEDCERLAWLPGGAGVTVTGEIEGREVEGSALWYEVLLDCPCLDFERSQLQDLPDTRDPERDAWYPLRLYWAPDSQRIAAATGDSLYVWNVASGERLLQASLDLISPGHVAWSPDGSQFAVGGGIPFADEGQEEAGPGRSLLLVNDDGTSPVLLPDQTGGVWGLAWSPDGTRLAAVGDEVRIWDSQSGEALLKIDGSATSVAWSPDGRRLVLTEHFDEESSALRVRDAASGALLRSLNSADGESIIKAAWAPVGNRVAFTTLTVVERSNDHLITGSTLYILDTDGQDPPTPLFETRDWLYDVDWSPDGLFLVLSPYGGVTVLDSGGGRTVAALVLPFPRSLQEWRDGRFFAEVVDWSSDGTRIVASGTFLGEIVAEVRAEAHIWDLTLIPAGPTRAFIHSSQLGNSEAENR